MGCVCVLFNARLVCAEGTDHSASRGASGVPAQPKAAGQLGAGSPRQSIYMCFLGHLVGAHSTALVGVCTKERVTPGGWRLGGGGGGWRLGGDGGPPVRRIAS